MAFEEIASLKRSSIALLWTIYALRLHGKGVGYKGLKALNGLRHKPDYLTMQELFENKLIINYSRNAVAAKLTLSPKGLALMNELCSTH